MILNYKHSRIIVNRVRKRKLMENKIIIKRKNQNFITNIYIYVIISYKYVISQYSCINIITNNNILYYAIININMLMLINILKYLFGIFIVCQRTNINTSFEQFDRLCRAE